MLLIGNKASKNHGCNFNYEGIEIIHENEEIDSILKGLNITEKPYYINHGIKYFKGEEGDVVLYDATRLSGLKKVLELNFNTKNKAKSVNFLTNLAYYASKIKFRKINVTTWDKYLYKFLFYKNECELRIDESFKGEYASIYNRFLFLSSADNSSLTSPYTYLDYEEFDRLSVLSMVTKEESGKPIYDSLILSNKHSLVCANDFNSLNSSKRLDAVMEKLYCDTITEYIIPKLERKGTLGTNIEQCFSMAIMNLATNVTYPEFFRNYIINNYLNIISEYNTDFIALALDIYKYEIISIK